MSASTTIILLVLLKIASASPGSLTLTRWDNTAHAGPGSSSSQPTLDRISDCQENCGLPSSLRLTGQLRPPAPGNYGFNVTFDPPLSYPSEEAYARLWVHDHLLYPLSTGAAMNQPKPGDRVPLWIPLPPRALDGRMQPIEHTGTSNLSSYEFRFEYVCLKNSGCGSRKISIRWATFGSTFEPQEQMPEFTAVPSSAMLPLQSGPEATRRQLYSDLQQGWGTFYQPGLLTWVLLPESFALKIGLFRLSTGAWLSPEGLTINPGALHSFAIRAGLHSYDNSYIEAALTWRGAGGNLNISIATTVDQTASSYLTMAVNVNRGCGGCATVNASDYLLVLIPNFTHGRAGSVSASSSGVSGTSAGLRTTKISLVQGAPVDLTGLNTTLLPAGPKLAISLELSDVQPVVLSANASDTASAVLNKTAQYRMQEAATLDKYGTEWGEVADAVQSSLMWSFMYDPKEGLVAPVTRTSESLLVEAGQCRNWGFSPLTVDGDQSDALFCWDGSFASYMLSLDALDLSLSNLIQIVKMRTSAGFIPSYAAGTLKSRDRTNPPVTSNILHKIVKRWGDLKTRWVVELCFDDLLIWNSWMFARRREVPEGLLSWGSDPYPYAPDGSAAAQGTGGGGAALESGLDNGPVFEGVPFNASGLYLQDEYDAGYTGMFLMDCQALIALAEVIDRIDVIATLQSRFDVVQSAMQKVLWNATAGYFQNKLSADLAPVTRMAPTHFYPMLAGPANGPSEDQAKTTIVKHLTNPARFAVWPTKEPPADHPPPAPEARPLVQWQTKGPNPTHTLCCQLSCDFIQRVNSKVRYEGMGLGSIPADPSLHQDLVPLFVYRCGGINSTDFTYGVKDWNATESEGGPCEIVKPTDPHNKDFPSSVALYTYSTSSGPSKSDMVQLELWYSSANGGDHYSTSSEEGKAEAKVLGYTFMHGLGWVWPAPGTANATSLYGLPSISKDDKDYKDQNYWHGRTWSPMIQLVYWGLEQYTSTEAVGARQGLVAQSKALLLKEWRGYGNSSMPGGSYAGSGRYVYENFGADTAEGYGYSSEAQPMYSWGALAGFIGLQEAGFY